MAKIMLVEDDTNLLEIYGARLLAEGYEVVSAKDGEEALAMAVKEKPDLIISDIMMPKISGFDMLDILRSTPETKNAKVIMMTALNQAEDKERADKLGADRYLVKSQVTLEDVAQAAKEALGEAAPAPADATPPAVETTPAATTETATTAPAPAPITDAPAPAVVTTEATPTPAPAATPVPTVTPAQETPASESAQSTPVDQLPPATPDLNAATSVHTKIINPINDLNKQSEDLKKLIAEEENKEKVSQPPEATTLSPAPGSTSTQEPTPVPTVTPAPAPSEASPAVEPAPAAAPTQIPVIVPPETPPTPQS
jgi:CheY-like chemotaxis protein